MGTELPSRARGMIDESELTAYHEAGHCVMAIVMGAEASIASIVPDGERFYGQVEIRWPGRRTVQQELAVVLAGPVAEMIYSGEPYHPGLVAEWAQDWKRAWVLAKRLHAEDIPRLRFLERFVASLHSQLSTESYWAAIAGVSDLLLAHEEIEHEQISDEVAVWLGRYP